MSSIYNRRIPEFVRNLTALYNDATVVDRVDGQDWYPNAHRIVIDWSATYGYSIATTASVIAALSPQVSWEHNLIIADDVLAGRAPSLRGYIRRNLTSAECIRDNRLSNTLATMPHGPKVASFACNLAGDFQMVTVDTHATQAALADVKATVSLHWPAYAAFAEAYRLAAWQLNLEPATFQAIIWHAWKRLYPRVKKINLRKQWEVVGEY